MEASFQLAEAIVKHAVQWLRLAVETTGALVIAWGIVVTASALGRTMFSQGSTNFNEIRIAFARYLALALEFQLAADILSTAIAPGWNEIKQLAAIAVIRTGLNFFLMREMKEEQSRTASQEAKPQEPSLSV